MNHFYYIHGILNVEGAIVSELALQYGTPLYIYSTKTWVQHYEAVDGAFAGVPHITCYSVKANSNLALLHLLARRGAGADIVSGGELFRALRAGIPAERIVFSGVGKTDREIREALDAGILMFNVESIMELERISEIAEGLKKTARVSLRINPDVDPKTHPYISTGLRQNKFGIPMSEAMAAYELAAKLPGVEPVGIDCHIGSQLTELAPILDALDRLLHFYHQLTAKGFAIRYLDIGGGLGITYDTEEPPHPNELGAAVAKALEGLDVTLIIEPGRVIAGNAGILVTKVLYTKENGDKQFVVVDAGMNDLVRPSLYGAYHRIHPAVERVGMPIIKADIVGPICESGDFLAKDREIPMVEPWDFLVVFSAGAYGMAMSSQYNSRRRAAEVLVHGEYHTLIRRRETYQDLVAAEEECLDDLIKNDLDHIETLLRHYQ